MTPLPMFRFASIALASALVAGCAMPASDADVSAKATEVMKASFREAGQAKLDRLDQDETQRLCSRYAGKDVPKDVAARIEQANLATIRYPADGRLMGDWKSGERIAQDGRGKQFSDDPKAFTTAELDKAFAAARDLAASSDARWFSDCLRSGPIFAPATNRG